jgi:hypothetical protein
MKFAVATELQIAHWYKPALRDLLTPRSLLLHKNDLEFITGEMLQELLLWKNRIDEKRTSVILGYRIQSISFNCDYDHSCARNLIPTWETFANSKEPMRKAVAELIDSIQTSPICASCREEILEDVEGSRMAYAEEDLITEAAASLYVKHFGDVVDGI